MGKDVFYFPHDYGARNDPKLIKLVMNNGLDSGFIYWCLVEMLYEQDGFLLLSECESYAFAMHTQCDKVKAVIDSELFKKDNEKFWSESVLRRLEKRKIKSQKASNSAKIKWKNANAMQSQGDRNANAKYKRKGKENKVNNINIPFDSETFKNTWEEWVKFRKEIKKSLTPTSINRQFKLLSKYQEEEAIEMLNKSMVNGYQGIFPLNDNGKKTKSMTDEQRKEIIRAGLK